MGLLLFSTVFYVTYSERLVRLYLTRLQTAMDNVIVFIIMKRKMNRNVSSSLTTTLPLTPFSLWISLSKTAEICRKTNLCYTPPARRFLRTV